MPESPPNLPDPSKPSFLKRWLGWRIIALTVVLLVLLSPVLYRGWRLGQVPVADEPFDVEAFQTKVADDENAAKLLLQAAEKLVDVTQADQDAYFEESNDGWDPGDATLDRYLTANEAALEIWRTAADRSSFQFEPDQSDPESAINFYPALRQLNRFAVKQIEKETATGNPRAAVPWIEAMMRHARLLQQNSDGFFSIAIVYFAVASKAANDWSVHPDLQRQDIDQVLGTIIEAKQLCPLPSETIKTGYASSRKAWDEMIIDDYLKPYRDRGLEPPLGSQWRWWLEGEPQFTIRLLPHITRNHLLFIDEPRRDRPPVIGGDLFDDSSLPPAKSGEIDAQSLSRLMLKSRLLNAESKEALAQYLDTIDRDEARYRCLTVALAAQAYFRDHGEFPENAVELVPEYLEDIPDDLFSPTPAPLIYRRDGDGAVVYSRFTNEIDDGGTVIDYNENRSGGELPDFGYRIRHPSDRPLRAQKP